MSSHQDQAPAPAIFWPLFAIAVVLAIVLVCLTAFYGKDINLLLWAGVTVASMIALAAMVASLDRAKLAVGLVLVYIIAGLAALPFLL